MSFLKKTNLGTPAATTTPKLGGTLGTKKLGGGLKTNLTTQAKEPKEIDLEPQAETTAKPVLATKKLGGGLGKKLTAKKPLETTTVKEEVKAEDTVTVDGITFDKVENADLELDKAPTVEPEVVQEETPVVVEEEKETVETVEEEVIEEAPKKKTSTNNKKKSSNNKKKTDNKKSEEEILKSLEVDESKRVSLTEMDSIMRPIVAPTTESWEQEKKDVLDALNNIKVEQDMTMGQVKNCLADLDELNFEILPKLHDAETMYDGTKQNYDTVKAIAIAKGSATNAEGRKAEGILACQNFVTPSGAVVDLHQYMLLIEERYKFYQKIVDGINFKKYSLVNYNNALKVENKNA